jgi:hypothetical protein
MTKYYIRSEYERAGFMLGFDSPERPFSGRTVFVRQTWATFSRHFHSSGVQEVGRAPSRRPPATEARSPGLPTADRRA